MIGSSLLTECLKSPDITKVLTIGRSPLPIDHPKLEQIHFNPFNPSAELVDLMRGYDACVFSIGTTSVGITQETYLEITKSYAEKIADFCLMANPKIAFVFISAWGADPRGWSPLFWARVKGATEASLTKRRFQRYYVFRPAYVQPCGIELSVLWPYKLFAPLYPFWRRLFPGLTTTTRILSRAILNAVVKNIPSGLFGPKEINSLGSAPIDDVP